jgi:hypothetical protein
MILVAGRRTDGFGGAPIIKDAPHFVKVESTFETMRERVEKAVTAAQNNSIPFLTKADALRDLDIISDLL